ncbi:MAG: DHA2 family efflux MFS transporter permease subunit [Candidatus Binataceae bacterium]|jgi:DHA2 family multidrug resistance protein
MSAAAAEPSPTHEETSAHFSAGRKWIIALSVMLGTVLEVLDSSIVNVSLPHMQGSFSASVDEIAWVVTSYLVAAGIMIPMTGWIAGRFGRKRYFMFSIAAFVLASALCGVARSLDQIVFFRLLQGAAGAAMMPLSQAILMETFPPHEQAMAMAIWGVGLMVAPIMGPTVGGWITDAATWRWNFYINVPIGTAAAFLVSRFVEDPSYLRHLRQKSGIDYLGIICLVVALGLAEIVLDRGERSDWFASSWVWYCTLTSMAAFTLLAFHEWRTPEPIVAVRILTNRNFTLPMSLLIFLTFTAYGTAILNPVFLQELLGYTASKAGMVMAPRGFGTMFAMLALGTVARRGVDTRPLVGLGFFLIAMALWFMAHFNLNVSIYSIVWPTIIQGFGMGLVFPGLSAAALSTIERPKMGYATSLFAMTRNLGAAIGTSSLTTMLIRREQVHQSYLVEHLSIFKVSQLSNSNLPSVNMDFVHQLATGQKQGLMMLYGFVQRHAMMLSFNDLYRFLCCIMLLAAPTFILLRRDTRALRSAREAH